MTSVRAVPGAASRTASVTRLVSRSNPSSSSRSFGCLNTVLCSGATPPRSTITRAKRSASDTPYFNSGRSAPPKFAPTISV
jgi:hypothetical protein